MQIISKEDRIRAHLGFAAMLNSTVVDGALIEDARAILAREIEAYFIYSPQEASQFNKEHMLALLDEYMTTGLLQMLHSIGKCPFETDSTNDRWEKSVEELLAGKLPHCKFRRDLFEEQSTLAGTPQQVTE